MGINGHQVITQRSYKPPLLALQATSVRIKDIFEFSKVFPSIQVTGFVQKPVGIKNLTNKILDIIGESKRRIYEQQ